MFTSTFETLSKTLYWLIVGTAAAWLAWLCLSNLPPLAAIIVFVLAAIPGAAILGPLAAGAALLGGIIGASVATGIRKLLTLWRAA